MITLLKKLWHNFEISMFLASPYHDKYYSTDEVIAMFEEED